MKERERENKKGKRERERERERGKREVGFGCNIHSLAVISLYQVGDISVGFVIMCVALGV